MFGSVAEQRKVLQAALERERPARRRVSKQKNTSHASVLYLWGTSENSNWLWQFTGIAHKGLANDSWKAEIISVIDI